VEEDVLGRSGGTAWELGKIMTGSKKRRLELLVDWGVGGGGGGGHGDVSELDVHEHEEAVRAVQLTTQAGMGIGDLAVQTSIRQDSIVNESPESRDKLKEANSKDTNVSVNNNIDTKDISDNDKLFNHNILVFSMPSPLEPATS
jgi:hypothetical protein